MKHMLYALSLVLPALLSAQETPASKPELSSYTIVKPWVVLLENDVYALEEAPVIVRPGRFIHEGDQCLVTTADTQGKDDIWVEMVWDWIEPVVCANLPDQIKLLEVKGTSEYATPDAPDMFKPASNDLVVPSGTRLRTGKDGMVVANFGGAHSARLVPGSEATITRSLDAEHDRVLVDLKTGGVFSKVKQNGDKVDYRVKTPRAVAAARGTDFVAVAMPETDDVWIAEGRVQLLDGQGAQVGIVASLDPAAPKILRYPLIEDVKANVMANSKSMGLAMKVIPTLNCHAMLIRAKAARGEHLTDEEQHYLQSIQKVRCLIKMHRSAATA